MPDVQRYRRAAHCDIGRSSVVFADDNLSQQWVNKEIRERSSPRELILAQPRRLTSAHDDPQEADVRF